MQTDSTSPRDDDAQDAHGLAAARREAVRLYRLASRNRAHYHGLASEDRARATIAGLIDRGVCRVVFTADTFGSPVRVLPRGALNRWRLSCCGRPAGAPEAGALVYSTAGELSCGSCAVLLGVSPRLADLRTDDAPGALDLADFLAATVKKGGLKRPAGGWRDHPDAPADDE